MSTSDHESAVTPREQRFPCGQCGAKLVFQPGTASLRCEYCGHVNEIARPVAEVQELNYHVELRELYEQELTDERRVVKCAACAAEIEPPADAMSFQCPFCGTDIVGVTTVKRVIRPRALLPFKVTREEARAAFRKWLRSLWFAPRGLKKYTHADSKLSGMYVPYWTYDCQTSSRYHGQRGDAYYVTEGYTTLEKGKWVRKSHRVRKIRWTRVSGLVRRTFDDMLVVASRSLPTQQVERLEPWDLKELTPYRAEYLSGFQAESHQVDLAEGFMIVTERLKPIIEQSVREDIGGDEQRIDNLHTHYDNVTFKHLLLPIWISAYRFRQKVYRFLVNGRTGEVQGERPWSWIKITLFVLLMVLLAAGIVLLVMYWNR